MARGDRADNRRVEDLLLCHEAPDAALTSERDRDRDRIEVAAMVRGDDRRAACAGMCSVASMSKRAKRIDCGRTTALERTVRFDADELGHAFGHVEIAHRPAEATSDHFETRVRVDGHRMTDGANSGRS